MKKRIKFCFFLSLTILFAQFSAAQQIPLPAEEAPLSIFSYQIGDENVDLFLSGFWQSSLSGGLGISWNSDNSKIDKGQFPGFTDGLIFEQSEDLLISLWLANKFFFEASIIDNYNLNTILFGYTAEEKDAFLQTVRIGNTDIGMGSYSFMNLTEASTDSLGVSASFKGENSEHQIALRYDPAEKGKKSFIGGYEISEDRIPLSDYVERQYFVLPDENVNDLKVYIEDSSGPYTDGSTKYRLADGNDAVVSAEKGFVFFKAPQNRKIAVHYTKNGYSVGDSNLGINALAADSNGLLTSGGKIDTSGTEHFYFTMPGDYLGIVMSTLEKTINSGTALLLYNPGEFSPFELLSVYETPYDIPEDSTLFKALLADNNLSTGEYANYSTGYFNTTIQFYSENGNSLRDPANRYPFAGKIDPAAVIYGPEREITGAPPDKELLLIKYDPVDSYTLGDNVLDGSVELSVNGIKNINFSFNPDSGTVELGFTPGSSDRLDFYYRTKASINRGGDLVLGLGNKFSISDSLTAEIGAGLRWNIFTGRYTENVNDAPGSILVSGGLNYKKENIDFKIDGGVSFYNPDTTGIFRLAGMDESSIPVPVTETLLYPAAPSPSLLALWLLTENDRGILKYNDYHSYNTLGDGTLMGYSWAVPVSQKYPYTDGGRTGPSIAGSNDEISGNTAVLEYELEKNKWTGGRIPLTFGEKGIDLSKTTSISFKVKLTGAVDSSNTGFYILTGKLNEDLDADGNLDEETAAFEPGFEFDPVNPQTGTGTLAMKVGSSPDGTFGNGRKDTEDLNGNGILDSEESSLAVYFEAGTTAGFLKPDSTWQTVVINLSPGEREKLRNTTGFDVFINYTGTGTGSGKLLIGDINFNGASFIVSPAAGQNVYVSEINETLIEQPGTKLTDDFPEISSLFTDTLSPANVAEFQWDSTGTWRAVSYTNPAHLSSYNKVSFYLKYLQSPDSLTVSIFNPDDQGVSFSFTPSGDLNKWHKYIFNLSSGTLTIDGNDASVTVIKNNQYAGNVQRLIIETTASVPGTFYLDEIHLEEPVYGVSGGAESYFAYKYPGELFSIGQTPVISNITFTNRSSVEGTSFASGFTAVDNTPAYTASSLAFTLLKASVESGLNLQKEREKIYISPSYLLSIPLLDWFTLSDHYAETNTSGNLAVTRESGGEFTFPQLSFSFEAGNSYGGDSLQQNWGTDFTGTFGSYGINSSVKLNLVTATSPYSVNDAKNNIPASYRLLYPSDGDNPGRSLSAVIDQSYTKEPVLYRLNEEFNASVDGTTERELSHSQKIVLEVPFVVNKWSVTPSYSRLLKMKTGASEDLFFTTDFMEAADNTLSQGYYFHSVPFYELFDKDVTTFSTDSAGFAEAEYNPFFSLEVSRPAGNRGLDIFIPALVRVTADRSVKRQWDTLTDVKTYSLDLSSSVFNLFGQLGSKPLISWYKTEEISGKTGVSVSIPSDSDAEFSTRWGQYLNFILSKDHSLSAESDINVSWMSLQVDGAVIATYSTKDPLEKGIKIPVIDPKGEAQIELTNAEKAVLKYSYTGDSAESIFSLSVNHGTDLAIGDKGTVSFNLGIGFSENQVHAESIQYRYYTAGFEAGIAAKLNF